MRKGVVQMNSGQKAVVRRRLERAHKDVVVDLCLRLMEANSALTRQLAHYFIRHPFRRARGQVGGGGDAPSSGAGKDATNAGHEGAPIAPDAIALQEGTSHE